jgi:transglutaminase-like putative cysteine protease
MSVFYRVSHRTEYMYAQEVSASYSQLHLLPRDLPGQRCHSAEVTIDPVPADYHERRDFFGNRVAYAAIHEAHHELTVTATSVVEIEDRAGLELFGRRPWEELRDRVRDGTLPDPVDAVQFVLDSPLVAPFPRIRDYAGASFPARRHLLDGVTDLCHRIHSDFAYVPGSTSVSTPLDEVFDGREGVCQDFAHLGIACLRALGLPARYVSGYLETDPPRGRAKLVGADVSHAWLSVLGPEGVWLEVDPTNDQLAGDRHIVTAYGRDYADVAPVGGVIYTEGATESLKVTVDVSRLRP